LYVSGVVIGLTNGPVVEYERISAVPDAEKIASESATTSFVPKSSDGVPSTSTITGLLGLATSTTWSPGEPPRRSEKPRMSRFPCFTKRFAFATSIVLSKRGELGVETSMALKIETDEPEENPEGGPIAKTVEPPTANA
jgi:hypothetical protein